MEAAVDLLIGHAGWLRRRDFLAVAVEFCLEPDGRLELAAVDWAAALGGLDGGDLPCSAGEEQLLRLAASLAGGAPIDLGWALSGLDRANAALVATAVAHASGHGTAAGSRLGW